MKKESIEYLNVAEYHFGTKALGPGNRFVLWVQGCPFTCAGCISKKWRSFEPAYLISVKDLAEKVASDKSIEGITLSGGEPFMQAGALSEFFKILKADRADLNVICFTGFYIEKLIWREAKELLTYIDVLIDGPYVADLNNNLGLRGSTNQRIHFVSDKLLGYKEWFLTGKRRIEYYLRENETLIVGVEEKSKINLGG